MRRRRRWRRSATAAASRLPWRAAPMNVRMEDRAQSNFMAPDRMMSSRSAWRLVQGGSPFAGASCVALPSGSDFSRFATSAGSLNELSRSALFMTRSNRSTLSANPCPSGISSSSRSDLVVVTISSSSCLIQSTKTFGIFAFWRLSAFSLTSTTASSGFNRGCRSSEASSLTVGNAGPLNLRGWPSRFAHICADSDEPVVVRPGRAQRGDA